MGAYWDCANGHQNEMPEYMTPGFCSYCEAPYDGSGYCQEDDPWTSDPDAFEDDPPPAPEKKKPHKKGSEPGCPEDCPGPHETLEFQLSEYDPGDPDDEDSGGYTDEDPTNLCPHMEQTLSLVPAESGHQLLTGYFTVKSGAGELRWPTGHGQEAGPGLSYQVSALYPGETVTVMGQASLSPSGLPTEEREISLRYHDCGQASCGHAGNAKYGFRYKIGGDVYELPDHEGDPYYADYSGVTLSSVWRIKQDYGDTDCGLACACFLRYGGSLAGGAPMEGEGQATGGTVQWLCTKMRQSLSNPNTSGTDPSQLQLILNGFANVFGARPYAWKREDLAASAEALSVGSYAAKVKAVLKRSPWGVAVPYWSTGTKLTTEDAPGGYHWIVCTRIQGDVTTIYDPGSYLPNQRRVIATKDFVKAAQFGSDGPGVGGKASVLCSYPSSGAQIEAGEDLLEIDAGWGTWGQVLTAKSKATWYRNFVEADAAADAAGGNAVVLEDTKHRFAVVRVQDEISASNVEGGDAERGGRATWASENQARSIRLSLTAGGERFKRLNVLSKKSVRRWKAN